MTLSFSETLSASETKEPADLSEIVAEQVDAMIGSTEAKNQSVTVAVPVRLKTACSAFDLGVMLGNLLRNAMHCTGPDGRITVEAGLEHDEDGTQWVALRVIDNGIGIPPDDQERIFERFYRVDKARSPLTGGAGLGLAIVKQFAEKNGGSVVLSSTPGQGSTFTVRLPAG
jgi:two-component system sensor histidine kinase SenX3